jgi:hypothetical protein
MDDRSMSEAVTRKAPAGDLGAETDPAPALTDATVLELLRRGVRAASASSRSSGQEAADEAQAVRQLMANGKYSGLSDPAGAEQLGQALGSRLARTRPDVLLVWEDVEDVVLGYVVARVLGVTVVRTYDAEGIVACSGEIGRGARAVAVTDSVRDPTVMRALRSVVERSGGELVAIGTLVGSTLAPSDVEVVTLVDGEDGASPASGAEGTGPG